MPIGLALSGGGARGDFEVGAARYLYNSGIRPDVISGASVGAINGIKLAEGELPKSGKVPLPGSYPPGLEGLERIWLTDMTSAKEMFLEEEWFAQRPTLRRVFYGGERSSDKYEEDWNWGAFNNAATRFLVKTMQGFIDAPKDIIRCGNFCGEMAGLQELMKGPVPPKSVFNITPIRKKLEDNNKLDLTRVSKSGIKLRLGVVSLESGELRYVTEKGELLGTDDVVGLIDAVMASASIPGMFPPVKLGSEWYVDGGVRETVPIQAAIDAGATEVYAIAASAPVAPAPSFDGANMITIAARAGMEIMTDETVRNEVSPTGGWTTPVTVIRPTFDIHDITTVDPGLTSITMAYGYMRAFDAVEGDEASARETDEIIKMRKKIWTLEHAANGRQTPWARWSPPLRPSPDPAVFSIVRDAKEGLKRALDARLLKLGSRAIPPRTVDWWLGWERHPWSPMTKTPWNRFEYVTTVDEMTPPYDSRPAACTPDPEHERIQIFARGSDRTCWSRTFDQPGEWSDWVSLGGVLTSDPVAIVMNGVSWVFVRGTDNGFWFRSTEGPDQSSSRWSPLKANAKSAPAACSPDPDHGRIDVFMRGMDDKCYLASKVESEAWSDWVSLEGVLTSDPAAIVMNGVSWVFVRGTDNGFWFRSTEGADQPSSRWSSLKANAKSAPAACSPDPDHGRIDVFMRGVDDKCYLASKDESGEWSDWVSLEGVLTSDPAAMVMNGVSWVFVRGTDNEIYFLWTKGAGQARSEWQPVR